MNIISMLSFLMLVAFILRWRKKIRASKILFIASFILFYAFSTSWLPRGLAKNLERQYKPLNPSTLANHPGKLYIHLLGSGCDYDYSLPATTRLGATAQGRLVESIRLFRALPNSVLVCSGGAPPGMESQAAVAKKAAILLGADSTRIITLDSPNTTEEEAASLAKTIGVSSTVIVVTDAVHMPRACKYFSQQGFSPLASPTGFRGAGGVVMKWWPSLENLTVMNHVVHEYLGLIKSSLF